MIGIKGVLKIKISIALIAVMVNTKVFCQMLKPFETDSIFKKYSLSNKEHLNNIFYIFKTSSNATNCNFKIVKRITDQISIAEITDINTLNNTKNCIEKIAIANSKWKYAPQAFELFKKNKQNTYTIIVADLKKFLLKWKKQNTDFLILQVVNEHNALIVKCNSLFFEKYILPDNDVHYVDIYTSPQTEIQLIGYNRSVNKINLANENLPSVNGNGITIGIKEKLMDVADIDLQKRINTSTISSSEIDNHATIISTLAGGAGNSFYLGKGLAWKSNFFSSTYNNLFPDNASILLQNNVTVQNHSYGTIIQNFYGAETLAYDEQTWQNKNLVHLFSSGNKGQEASTVGIYANINGYSNLTGNFKMAKNIITVAATDTAENIELFSSKGPIYDGRMAPQLAALGPNGTSDAAAIVSGAVAVIQQVYKDSNNNILPTAATVKCILYNSADDIATKGIDYKSGFGALNIYKAIKLLHQRKYENNQLAQNESWVKNIIIPPQAANLKITLSWTDTAGALLNNKALQNDIDIELTEINTGIKFYPWVLNSSANVDSLKLLPTRKKDAINTAEQISIDNPTAGNYQIKIIGTQIQTINKQPFSIAYSWDTLNILHFTNPINADDVNRIEDENLVIKWNIALQDTNQVGNLAVSYNNGITWNTIAFAIKLNFQKYRWHIPDTSTTAKFKIECTFGTFFSNSFIIAPTTKVNLAFFCNDSIQLSWNPHLYANEYTIYSLLDSAYMKIIGTTIDTSIILQKNIHSGNIFAIQPRLNNGLLATKSAAIDIRTQGVKCYYKSLLADIEGNNVTITLELSTTINIDSVQFEKVNQQGILIEKLDKQIVLIGGYIFTTKDKNPTLGNNYYRAKIYLKNGLFIYSEIASVISIGNKFIFIYPNPARINDAIHFLIKENASNLKLIVYDIQGRVLKTQAIGLSGKINTTNLNSGIFIFKIINNNGIVLDTGKFIISN